MQKNRLVLDGRGCNYAPPPSPTQKPVKRGFHQTQNFGARGGFFPPHTQRKGGPGAKKSLGSPPSPSTSVRVRIVPLRSKTGGGREGGMMGIGHLTKGPNERDENLIIRLLLSSHSLKGGFRKEKKSGLRRQKGGEGVILRSR